MSIWCSMQVFCIFSTIATILIYGISARGKKHLFLKCFMYNSLQLCMHVFFGSSGCLLAVRAIVWPLPWHWVVHPTIAALPAICLVPVMPPEALLTGDRSPCLNSKKGGWEWGCDYLRLRLIQSVFPTTNVVFSKNTLKKQNLSTTGFATLKPSFFCSVVFFPLLYTQIYVSL